MTEEMLALHILRRMLAGSRFSQWAALERTGDDVRVSGRVLAVEGAVRVIVLVIPHGALPQLGAFLVRTRPTHWNQHGQAISAEGKIKCVESTRPVERAIASDKRLCLHCCWSLGFEMAQCACLPR